MTSVRKDGHEGLATGAGSERSQADTAGAQGIEASASTPVMGRVVSSSLGRQAEASALLGDLLDALAPFSKALGNIAAVDAARWPDNETIEHSGAAEEITWGDLRRARFSLSKYVQPCPPHSYGYASTVGYFYCGRCGKTVRHDEPDFAGLLAEHEAAIAKAAGAA